jgi:cytochrome c1
VGGFEGQPSVRWSLQGLNEEGDEAWLIRGIARKLYHCPGCHGEIEVGDEHTVVQFVRRLGGTDHHHWHRRCAEELLIPELRNLKRVPASESSQTRLEARGRTKPGRRRRHR